jgi:CPA1 family monovalent cation:H+ antiporter
LGLSKKTNTILEGESLVNDASALVAYRFAVAAVTGTTFVLWKASLQFVILMVGGFLIGLIMGKVMAILLKRVHQNYMVTISFMLLMPLVAYLMAEELHVSGVIAVVTLGLGVARISNKVFPEKLKQESKTIWDVIIFLLNGLIFIILGLALPRVAKYIDNSQFLPYTGYAFIIWLVALVLRTARVFLQQVNLQRAFKYKKGRITEQALLDFKTSLIISWSGMRGIVSLAIAIGLPMALQDGSPFPERSGIIYISVVVVLLTLIGQGLTLPWLVKRLAAPAPPTL